MDGVPYGWAFAVLCLLQGALVAARPSRPLRIGRSRLVGLALPIVVFLIGLAATRGGDWSTRAVTHLATFATPVLAATVGAVWGWRAPWAYAIAAPVAWVVAWQADGLGGDVAAVALICGACLTLAGVIAAASPQWALAAGLVVLAVVDAALVFTDQVRPGSDALHAIVPVGVGGTPLPALQDATLDSAQFGWLDILAPALAGTLLVMVPRWQRAAAAATAAAALALGLLLAITSQVPGTVPPLVAVGTWFLLRLRGVDTTPPVPAVDTARFSDSRRSR